MRYQHLTRPVGEGPFYTSRVHAVGISQSRSVLLVWGIVVAVLIVVIAATTLWGKYFGPPKYRGRRIINWTQAQQADARDWKRECDERALQIKRTQLDDD